MNEVNKLSTMNSIFDNIKDYNLIELLVLKAIVEESATLIPVKQISNRIVCYYWNIDFKYNNVRNPIIEDIKVKLIRNYNILEGVGDSDIIGILSFSQDKSIDLKLQNLIKTSFKKIIKNNNFFKSQSNGKITLINSYYEIIKNNKEEIINIINKYIKNIIDPSKKELNFINQEEQNFKTKENINEEEFNKLYELEKRIAFHNNMNLSNYKCLEDAFSWMNMDYDKFFGLHKTFTEHIKVRGFKDTSVKIPNLSAVLLLYSSIYIYNEESVGGLWDSYFGGKERYNYQKDVIKVMQLFKYLEKRYKIDSSKRLYFAHKNLSEVFSQIYLPEVSLRKLYSALYVYYFRANKRNYNKKSFLEYNLYRLDKPGEFFINDTMLLEDSFETLLLIMENNLTSDFTDGEFDVPRRIVESFKAWRDSEKKKIDHSQVEIYVSSPTIKLDNLNKNIYINLPKQSNNYYSDELCGWKVCIDNEKDIFIEGRIIRIQTGTYILLEETFEIGPFKKIEISYIYNNKTLKQWSFQSNLDYYIFNAKGQYRSASLMKREITYIAINNRIDFNIETIIEVNNILKWEDYNIYILDTTEYRYDEVFIGNNKIIIDNMPTIERKNFKLLFEEWNARGLYINEGIYEDFGILEIKNYNIDERDIEYKLHNLRMNTIDCDCFFIEKDNNNKLSLKLKNKISDGLYNLRIRYKGKICYRERFFLDKTTKVYIKKIKVDESNYYFKKRLEIVNKENIKIEAFNYETKIRENNNRYAVFADNGPVLEFIYKFEDSEILNTTIRSPLEIILYGIEDVFTKVNDSKVPEITKEILNQREIALNLTNLDSEYNNLTYKLSFYDIYSGDCINKEIRLKFGDNIIWKLDTVRDQVINYKNIEVILNIKDGERILYETVILYIKEFINIYDLQVITGKETTNISWKEKQYNFTRKLALYNITSPSAPRKDYILKDGIKGIDINNDDLTFGLYMIEVDFDKEESIFAIDNHEIKFFERDNLRNTFLNNNYNKKDCLAECILMFYERNYKIYNDLILEIKSKKLDPFKTLITIAQIRYLIGNEIEGKKYLINLSYTLLKEQCKENSIDFLIKMLLSKKDCIEVGLIVYLLECLIVLNIEHDLSNETIDAIAEVSAITALCASKNRNGRLSKVLIEKCKESFDLELLSLDVVGNMDRVVSIIEIEKNYINGFWEWITNYNNSYLLKKNYSNERLYRMYELEMDVSTYKVNGQTIDDIIHNLKNNREHNPYYIVLPAKWSGQIGVEEEEYNILYQLIKNHPNSPITEKSMSALISIARPEIYTDEQIYKNFMWQHIGCGSKAFDRYRAYIKLMFL